MAQRHNFSWLTEKKDKDDLLDKFRRFGRATPEPEPKPSRSQQLQADNQAISTLVNTAIENWKRTKQQAKAQEESVLKASQFRAAEPTERESRALSSVLKARSSQREDAKTIRPPEREQYRTGRWVRTTDYSLPEYKPRGLASQAPETQPEQPWWEQYVPEWAMNLYDDLTANQEEFGRAYMNYFPEAPEDIPDEPLRSRPPIPTTEVEVPPYREPEPEALPFSAEVPRYATPGYGPRSTIRYAQELGPEARLRRLAEYPARDVPPEEQEFANWQKWWMGIPGVESAINFWEELPPETRSAIAGGLMGGPAGAVAGYASGLVVPEVIERLGYETPQVLEDIDYTNRIRQENEKRAALGLPPLSTDVTPAGAVIERAREAQRLREEGELYQRVDVPAQYWALRALAAPLQGAGDILDWWQAGMELFALSKWPTDDLTQGQRWAVTAKGVGDWLRAFANPDAPQPQRNLFSQIEMARKVLNSNLQPSVEQLMGATPEELVRAAAQATSMNYHGVASIGQQFDNILDYSRLSREKQEQARQYYEEAVTTDDPIYRQQLLQSAAALSADAVELENTHPLELFDKNANWVMALPYEFLFDPANYLEFGLKFAGLTPKIASRIKNMRRLSIDVPDVSRMVGRVLKEHNENYVGNDNLIVKYLQNWFQTAQSKAKVDAYTNYGTVTNLARWVETKEDMRIILDAVATNLEGLINNGIPVEQLTSPTLHRQATGDTWYPLWMGLDTDIARQAYGTIRNIADQFQHWPSLQGEGLLDKSEFVADLLGSLKRAGAERFDRATLPGVPWGTVDMKITPMTGGQAIIEYLNEAGDAIGTSMPMLSHQADARMQELMTYLKRGQEFVGAGITRPAETGRAFANAMRHITSTFLITANPSTIFTNAFGGNFAALWDGTNSLWGLGDQVDYIARKFQFSATARQAGEMGAMGREFWGGGPIVENLPKWAGGDVLRWLQEQRAGMTTLGGWFGLDNIKFGEEGMAFNIFANSVRGFLHRYWPGRAAKDLKPLFESYGILDPNIQRRMTNQIIDMGLRGNGDDLSRLVMSWVDGFSGAALSELEPAARDLLGRQTQEQIDELLRAVRPENVEEVLEQLTAIVRTRIDEVEQNLLRGEPFKERRILTAKDIEEDTRDLLTQMRTATDNLGIDPSAADDAAKRFRMLQQEIGAQINHLAQQMAAVDSRYSPVFLTVWDTWQRALDGMRRWSDEAISEAYRYTSGTEEAAEAWARYYNQYGDHSRAMYDLVIDRIQEAHEIMQRGDLEAIRRYAGASTEELLRKMAAPLDQAMGTLEIPSGWGRDDPVRQARIQAGRDVVDKFKSMAWLAYIRNPSQEALDSLISGLKAVGNFAGYTAAQVFEHKQNFFDTVGEGASKVDMAQFYGRMDELWANYYEYAMRRMNGTAMEILRPLIDQKYREALTFTLYGDNRRWTVVAPKLNNPKLWFVYHVDPETGKTVRRFMPLSQLPNGKQVIASYEAVREAIERELIEATGQLARQTVLDSGIDTEEILNLVKQIRGEKYDEIWQKGMSDLAQELADLKGRVFDPTEADHYARDTLYGFLDTLQRRLPELAQNNQQRIAVSGEFVADFNRTVRPIYENLLTLARDHGDEMVGLGVLHYIREYGPDVLLGLRAPYHFFFTRMGKNAVYRMLFSPRLFSNLVHWRKWHESRSREEDMPARAREAIQTGIHIGDWNLPIYDPVINWAPFLPTFAGNGWANPVRANQGFDYIAEALGEREFPQFAKGLWGTYLVGEELLQQTGISRFPWWNMALAELEARANKEPSEARLGQMGPLFDAAGWYLLSPYSKWIPEGIREPVGEALRPWYTPYLVGREATRQAGLGNISDLAGEAIQGIAQQRLWDTPDVPFQDQYFPQAEEDYEGLSASVGTQYLLRRLFNWLTPLSVAPVSETELATRVGAEEYGRRGPERWWYDPETGRVGKVGSPYGTREGQLSLITPGNEAYIAGVAPQRTQYQIMQEYQPGQEYRSPMRSAVTGAIFDEMEATREARERAGAEAVEPLFEGMEPLPGIRQGDVSGARYEAEKPWQERLKELQQQLEEIQGPEGGETFSRYNLMSPLEARIAQIDDTYYYYLFDYGSEREPEWPGDDADQEQKSQFYEEMEALDQEKRQAFIEAMTAPTEMTAVDRARRGGLASPVQLTEEEAAKAWDDRQIRYYLETTLPAERALRETTSRFWDKIESSNEAQKENARQRGGKKWVRLLEQRSAIEDREERSSFTDANPEISLALTAAHDPEKYDTLIEKFGKDAWEVYEYGRRERPEHPGDEATDEQMADYYSQLNEFNAKYPRYNEIRFFLFGRWDWEWSTDLASRRFAHDFGRDYEEAQRIFGEDIFELEREKNAASTADRWREWVNANPEANMRTTAFNEWKQARSEMPDLLDISDLPQVQWQGDVGRENVSVLPEGLSRPGPAEPDAGLADRIRAVAAGEPGQGIREPRGPIQSIREWAMQSEGFARSEEFRARVRSVYGIFGDEVGSLYEQYLALPKGEARRRFKAQHRILRAVSLYTWHPDQYATIEDMFGKGAVEEWANIPAWSDTDAARKARSAYYDAHPNSFLVNAYLYGRPGRIDESAEDDEDTFYDFGQDYAEAQRLFGENIWSVVAGYKRGWDKETKSAYYDQHPQLSDFWSWWYANLPSNQQKQYSNYYRFGDRGGRWFGSWTPETPGEDRGRPYGVSIGALTQAEPFNLPEWRPAAVSADDWRKWAGILGPSQRRSSWRSW